MNSIALLFLIASCAYGASIPVVSNVVNPCVDSELYFLRYYQPYPLDERRYIQCDPWGNMEVRDCSEGARWSSWLGRCSDGSLERSFGNMSLPLNDTVVPEVPSLTPNFVFPGNASFCSYYGNDTCLNGGLCNFYPTGSRCVCIGNYSGDYCQVRDVRSFGVFGQLINDSFSLDVYRRSRPLMDEYYVYNGTIDTSMVADEVTRRYIQEYLALYPNGTMRFDMLVNYLIQDYLSLIYPWQFFLQEFGYQSEVQMGYVNAIPGLLLSSKYSYDRYFDMWALYDDVLHKLIDYLPRYLPNIHREAELFYQIYDGIFREFERSGNFSAMMANYTSSFGNVSYVTIEMIRDKIYRDFNETLGLSYSLFDLLGRFDEEIGVRAASASTPSVMNTTYIQEVVANFSLSDNVTSLIAALSESNAEIWDSLSFYGFWSIVSEFVPEEILNATRNSTFFLNGSAIARLVRPSRPNGVFRSNAYPDQVPVFQALVGDDEDDENDMWSTTTTTGQLAVDEPEKLVANDTRFEQLVGEVNGTTVPVPQHLVADFVNSTVLPEHLVADFNGTTVAPQPLVGNGTFLRSENFLTFNETFVVPEHLLGEFNGTTVPVPEHLVADFVNSTVLPEHLVAELNGTTVVPQALEVDFNGTVVAPEKLVAFNETVVPQSLVWDESERVVLNASIPQSLVADFNGTDFERSVSLNVSIPQALVGNSTFVRSDNMARINQTFFVPEQLVADFVNSTVLPEHLVAELNGTTVVPQALESDFNSTVTRALRFMGFNETVERSLVNDQVDESFVRPEALVSVVNGTIQTRFVADSVRDTTSVPVTTTTRV